MSTAIAWFRRDLRLDDNAALTAACDRHDRVIPVYIHAPGEAGPWPPGGARKWWLHHALAALRGDLQSLGSNLLLRQGESLAVLREIIRRTGATGLYWNRLYEPALRERDNAVQRALAAEADLEIETFPGHLLFEPERVKIYRIFTPFWNHISTALDAKPVPPVTDIPGTFPRDLAGDHIDDLGLLPAIPWDEGLYATWQPGEVAARKRLQSLLDNRIADYADQRDLPALPGTSALSPHLHGGETSPRRIVTALQDAAPTPGRDAFLRELGWREFSAHLLHHFPQTPHEPLNERFHDFPWRDAGGEAAQDLRAWQSGTTGIPLVDAGMRQLWYSGWMHNRVRMVVASFLTKNLRIHWLHGARWFWDTLVDADLANNTQGWQWTAGSGADAAPYFRIFNPVRQGERFDPDGDYVRQWLPELKNLPARYIHAPWSAPEKVLSDADVRISETFPEPLVDLKASRRAALDAFATIKQGRSEA